jgi:hypothetical protein
VAKPNVRPQSVIPQAKVRTLQSIRDETPAEIRRRECLSFTTLEDGLNTIHGISVVLDYVGEMCQGNGQEKSLSIITAGLGEALKVVHRRLTAEVEVES